MNLDLDLCWEKLKNGDQSGLEIIYKSTFRSLVFYAKEITGQSMLAEEVVQDIFLKIWQNRSQLSDIVSFKSYLFKSVHNQALNAVRLQNTRKESVNMPGSDKIWKFISDTYEINENFLERIFSDETESLIEREIQELPEQCRKVFLLSRVELLKNEEIALKLGLSENTIKTHIYRALQKISLALKNDL